MRLFRGNLHCNERQMNAVRTEFQIMDRGPFVPKAEQKPAVGDVVRGAEKESDSLTLKKLQKSLTFALPQWSIFGSPSLLPLEY